MAQTGVGLQWLKQVELSRYLTIRLGRSVDASAIHKMSRSSRRMFADKMLLIGHACSYDLPILFALDGIPDKQELHRRDALLKRYRADKKGDDAREEAFPDTIRCTSEFMKVSIVFEISQMDVTLTNKQINMTADRIVQTLRDEIMNRDLAYQAGRSAADKR